MKKAIALLPLIWLLPFSLAFDCNRLGDDMELCNEVTSSSLNDSEKELLILDIMNKKENYPDHESVYEWNTNTDHQPDTLHSSGFIKDAWLRIIAIMPTVIKNEVLSPGYGEILSAFDYKVELPEDYYADSYPDSDNGDCRRQYRLISDNYWLDNYANGDYIGNGTLVEFNKSRDIDFNVTLRIEVEAEIEHWAWHVWCCRLGRRCLQVCHECRHKITGSTSDEIVISDNTSVKYYNPSIDPQFRLTNQYYGTMQGKLDIANFSSFTLSFDNSSYEKFNYYYSFSSDQHNVLTIGANRFDEESSNNINVEDNNNSYNFIVHNATDCSLNISTHFRTWTEECTFNHTPIGLEIDTDKLAYSDGALISVDLQPKGADINVSYGDEVVTVKDETEFIAEYPYNKVTAELDDVKAQKIVHVKKKDSWDFLLNMGVFSSIIYVFYLVIKKYFGAIL